MPKTRRRRPDPLAGKRYNPLGTKKQSREHQQTRDLKNRIHDLEQHKAAVDETNRNTSALLERTQALLIAQRPTDDRIRALRRIAALSAADLVKVGIQHEAVTIALWVVDLDREVATGKAVR